jgi:hypothetical protein
MEERIKKLEERLDSQMNEMRDLKAALSYAIDSDDVAEIKKRAKRALLPFWNTEYFKEQVDNWRKGEYHK